MKKVIEEEPIINVVGIDNVLSHNIYAFVYEKEVFKLFHLNPNYAFFSISNTRTCYGNAKNTIKSTIINVMDEVEVLEFVSQIEFLEWALQQAKSCQTQS